MKLVIIGHGRAASALVPIWSRTHEVVVWSRRDGPIDAAPAAEVVVFAVPDGVIADVARALDARPSTPAEVWLHLSGIHAASLLRPSRARAVGCLHPLVALGVGVDPTGAIAGIEGEPAATAIAQQLARDAGLVPHAIPAERALYHAAAVTVAGHATALFSMAMRQLEAAGFDRDTARAALQPLMQSAVTNLRRGPPEAVITGPITRGDAATVARHVQALAVDPEALAVYRLLAREALRLATHPAEIEARITAALSP